MFSNKTAEGVGSPEAGCLLFSATMLKNVGLHRLWIAEDGCAEERVPLL